jgi:hypothetical protein
MMWVLPSSRMPRRIDAGSGTLPSRFERSQTTQLHCPGRCTPPRYPEAVAIPLAFFGDYASTAGRRIPSFFIRA